MAEIEKKSGQIKLELCSPGNLVEDITEMIKREESNNSLQLNDSQFTNTTEEETIHESSNISIQNDQVIKEFFYLVYHNVTLERKKESNLLFIFRCNMILESLH